MTEIEEAKVDELELDHDQQEIQELLTVLKPTIHKQEDGNMKLLLDWESGLSKLKSIKQNNEVVVIESDLLGIRVSMSSKKESLGAVQRKAHNSFKFMMKDAPCRVPLGVN